MSITANLDLGNGLKPMACEFVGGPMNGVKAAITFQGDAWQIDLQIEDEKVTYRRTDEVVDDRTVLRAEMAPGLPEFNKNQPELRNLLIVLLGKREEKTRVTCPSCNRVEKLLLMRRGERILYRCMVDCDASDVTRALIELAKKEGA